MKKAGFLNCSQSLNTVEFLGVGWNVFPVEMKYVVVKMAVDNLAYDVKYSIACCLTEWMT